MRGLITRMFGGQAPLPASSPAELLVRDIDAGVEQQRQRRLDRARRRTSKRFDHARPKVEQLRATLLTQHAQKLRDEAGA